MLLPLSSKMKANILERGLLTVISSCEVGPVAALLAFARAYENYWLGSEAIGWFLHHLASTVSFAVPEWNADGCRRDRSGDPLPRVAHPKVFTKIR